MLYPLPNLRKLRNRGKSELPDVPGDTESLSGDARSARHRIPRRPSVVSY